MDKLAETYFFKDLDGSELTALKRITRIEEFTENETILEQGQPSEDLYIVRTGSVRVLMPTPEGMKVDLADQTLVVLGPGECFGEFAFVDRGPSSAGVVAAEPCTAYAISYRDMDGTLLSEPQSALKIYKSLLHILVSRIRNTDIELAMRKAFGD